MNYGQEQGFYGELTHYVNEVVRATKTSHSITGMGLTMEGASVALALGLPAIIRRMLTTSRDEPERAGL